MAHVYDDIAIATQKASQPASTSTVSDVSNNARIPWTSFLVLSSAQSRVLEILAMFGYELFASFFYLALWDNIGLSWASQAMQLGTSRVR